MQFRALAVQLAVGQHFVGSLKACEDLGLERDEFIMTSSPQKRRANSVNALRSTGPRSVDGKRIAASNARLHGLSMRIDSNAL